ncbi:MAG: HPr kinase/phosphatase C-terminal domain-containing protein [Salaquimonas sp.]
MGVDAITSKEIDIHNHHGSMLQVSGRGVLIEGASGSGKTSLALGLIDWFKAKGHGALMVSDDQVILSHGEADGTLFLKADAPETIKGKVELYGLGIVDTPSIRSSQVDLIVRLIPDQLIERMPEERYDQLRGVLIPLLEVPERHEAQSIRLVNAKLELLFG